MTDTPPRVTPFADNEVTEILRSHWDSAAEPAVWIGAGAWSDCFAFGCAGRRHVIRVGTYEEDFAKDHAAAQFASADLPIPECGKSQPLPDGYHFCVSDYVEGIALERVKPWSQIAYPFVRLLEGLRQVDTSTFTGWGRWDDTLRAPFASWREFLLDVAVDRPGRISGWKAALENDVGGAAAFDRAFEILHATATDDVPRSLVHNDLLNRNVHVDSGQIMGVFDWGNSLVGDHLYDLGLLCFWEPWLEGTQPHQVLAGLRSRWAETGYECRAFESRLQACLVHTGLEHLAYHASRSDWQQVAKVAARVDAITTMQW